jgi:hypothetical protein
VAAGTKVALLPLAAQATPLQHRQAKEIPAALLLGPQVFMVLAAAAAQVLLAVMAQVQQAAQAERGLAIQFLGHP